MYQKRVATKHAYGYCSASQVKIDIHVQKTDSTRVSNRTHSASKKDVYEISCGKNSGYTLISGLHMRKSNVIVPHNINASTRKLTLNKISTSLNEYLTTETCLFRIRVAYSHIARIGCASKRNGARHFRCYTSTHRQNDWWFPTGWILDIFEAIRTDSYTVRDDIHRPWRAYLRGLCNESMCFYCSSKISSRPLTEAHNTGWVSWPQRSGDDFIHARKHMRVWMFFVYI